MAGAHVAKGIHNTLGRKDPIRGNKIFDQSIQTGHGPPHCNQRARGILL
jgi:hypothetical protein